MVDKLSNYQNNQPDFQKNMIKYSLKNISILISCFIFFGINGCNTNSDKSQNDDFKFDIILKESAKRQTNDEMKEAINQLIKTVPHSTKKVFNSFDDSEIHLVISGGFTFMSGYCSLIDKNYSSHKASETVKEIYEDTVGKHQSDLRESERQAISDYHNRSLEVAKKVCGS